MLEIAAVKPVLLLVRFLSEVGLVAGAFWAATSTALPLAVVVAVLLVVTWGAFVAPKAANRLDDPARLALEVVLFAAVSVGLVVAGHLVAGLALAVVGIGSAVGVRSAVDRHGLPFA